MKEKRKMMRETNKMCFKLKYKHFLLSSLLTCGDATKASLLPQSRQSERQGAELQSTNMNATRNRNSICPDSLFIPQFNVDILM